MRNELPGGQPMYYQESKGLSYERPDRRSSQYQKREQGKKQPGLAKASMLAALIIPLPVKGYRFGNYNSVYTFMEEMIGQELTIRKRWVL